MTKIYQIALIGIGHIAEFQLKALALNPNWKLVAASDLHAERQCLLPANIPFMNSIERLIEETEADIYLVSTPNQTHYNIGKTVLSRGANLLLEKPCCETHKELRELETLARKNNCFFSVALHAQNALDLRWFQQHHLELDLKLEDITRFECGFYDPYINHSELSVGATSLGGSWFDSGINALSVIGSFIDPNVLKISNSEFIMSHLKDCSDSQATVNFVYPGGTGTIQTNWTLGMNKKTTKLIFGRQEKEILLDHSDEKVIVFYKGDVIRVVDLSSEHPRLVSHYDGILNSLHVMFKQQTSNLSFSSTIHQLLFDALIFK